MPRAPTTTWPAVAASRGGVDLVNLGFAGSAMLDPFTARTMRDLPADLISVKLGINLVNADLMRLRAFAPAVHGFLDTIREGHPHHPAARRLALAVSHPRGHPRTYCMPDLRDLAAGKLSFLATGDAADPTRLTLTVIRDLLARIVAARAETDPHLHYLDGRELYGEAGLRRAAAARPAPPRCGHAPAHRRALRRPRLRSRRPARRPLIGASSLCP